RYGGGEAIGHIHRLPVADRARTGEAATGPFDDCTGAGTRPADRRRVRGGQTLAAGFARAHRGCNRRLPATDGWESAVTLEIAYPYVGAGKQPLPMKAQQIWAVAHQVRR